MSKALTVKQLIKQLQKCPQDATVRIFHTELCPDADFYIVTAEYDQDNAANEVTCLLQQEETESRD